jgi:4-hydroxyproline epimerase
MVEGLAGSAGMNGYPSAIRVVDSHTEGEPTRVVLDGGPDLGPGSLAGKLERFRAAHDDFRRSVILEPRGSDALVGALLVEPEDRTCAAGVIFFNNAGFLGMCGHGTIGVAVTLAHLGRIGPGRHRLETPVGTVGIELLDAHEVAIDNVPSWRYRAGVSLDVEGLGSIVGDIAWGGNWFFLVSTPPCDLVPGNIGRLTAAAEAVRRGLVGHRITGADGAEIDHIEFFGPPQAADADSRNFVLCPGGAFDRSPCGTGTSAKIACLAADGKLAPGETWVQESIIGSRFTASYRCGDGGAVIPTIRGRAYVCGEATLIRQPGDPFATGIVLGTMP